MEIHNWEILRKSKVKGKVGELEAELYDFGLAPCVKRLRETMLDALFRENDRTGEFLLVQMVKWASLVLVRPSFTRGLHGAFRCRATRLVSYSEEMSLHSVDVTFFSHPAPQSKS